eukprot:2170986-Rhodomonas_salina.1
MCYRQGRIAGLWTVGVLRGNSKYLAERNDSIHNRLLGYGIEAASHHQYTQYYNLSAQSFLVLFVPLSRDVHFYEWYTGTCVFYSLRTALAPSDTGTKALCYQMQLQACTSGNYYEFFDRGTQELPVQTFAVHTTKSISAAF